MKMFVFGILRAPIWVLPFVLLGTACTSHNAAPTPPAFQVGTTTVDPQLPPAPQLPLDAEVCATVIASNKLVVRPDGALPPESDPSTSALPKDPDPTNPIPWAQRGPASVYGVDTTDNPYWYNPDQFRIQQALNACGATVDAQVGAAISAADALAGAPGVSGEELTKPAYKPTTFAVRLVVNPGGGDAFISGPLWLPSGVTLWIDSGVTLFASRDVMAYNLAGSTTTYCGNVAVSATSAGSSSNCNSFINGNNLVNSAIMGDGSIDGRGYAELVSSDALYPLLRANLTCTNTYAAYATGTQAPDGTGCDDGATVVEAASNSRNMTWWDLAYLGNLVENGTTGAAGQSNFRLMAFNNAKNLTLYRITLSNSPNFHVVPAGVDGLTVWGVKLLTPTLAAYANPAGNGNPLYTGVTFDKDNVKNTDAFDPSANSFAAAAPTATNYLATGATIATTVTPGGNGYSEAVLTTKGTEFSGATATFDGYLKNVVFAYNFISTGDDDIALKGAKTPVAGTSGIDGLRDVRGDRKWGVIIAHNHVYWGHGISIGSETNGGVANVHVYDNSFNGSEEGLRIKSDYSRGGEVKNVYYDDICIQNADNALLFTAYYSTKMLPANGIPLDPNFHDIFLNDVGIIGSAAVKFVGFAANTGGFGNAANPLVISLQNVLAASPDSISIIDSDAQFTLDNVNLPIQPSTDLRVEVVGTANQNATLASAVDCSQAFVDFPSPFSPAGTTW